MTSSFLVGLWAWCVTLPHIVPLGWCKALTALSQSYTTCSTVEVVENGEEECDTDLERQNVEELYDHVRLVHQNESQDVMYDVKHKALIPILRLYQSQAVNWMLSREKYRKPTPKGSLHRLW